MLFLPNNPATTKGLTDAEREWISWNFELDQGQKDHKEELTGMQAFVLAVTDPKTWLLMATLYMVCACASSPAEIDAISDVYRRRCGQLLPLRREHFGIQVSRFLMKAVYTLTHKQSQHHLRAHRPSIPALRGNHDRQWFPLRQGIIATPPLSPMSHPPTQTQERYLHIVIPLVFTIIANIIALSTLNTAARCTSPQLHFTLWLILSDVAMMLMPGSFYGATAVILSWIAGSITQPAVKRAAAISLINAVCNTPNSASPFCLCL